MSFLEVEELSSSTGRSLHVNMLSVYCSHTRRKLPKSLKVPGRTSHLINIRIRHINGLESIPNSLAYLFHYRTHCSSAGPETKCYSVETITSYQISEIHNKKVHNIILSQYVSTFVTGDLAKKKWDSLREGFVRKHNATTRSGQAATNKREHRFAKELEFLIPHITSRK